MKNTADIKRGTPATIRVYSDTYPAVVTRTSPKSVWVKRVRNASIKRGETGGIGWDREASEKDLLQALHSDAVEHRFTLRQNGRYVEQGQDMRTGRSVSFGVAREYRDPHF